MHDVYIAAIITFSVSSFGTVTNLLVLYAARRIHSMNSSFGMITKSQAVCNTAMSLVFLAYVFPMQLSDKDHIRNYSHFLGLIAMTVNEVSNLSHLLIALNRFCAVFLPSDYEKLFGNLQTKIMNTIIWSVSLVLCVLLYEIIGCHLTYDDSTWTFVFPPSDECTRLTWFSDFAFNISLTVMTLIINLLTAYKSGKTNRLLTNAAGVKMSKIQRQRERNFVKQTFFQGATVAVGQLTYYVIAPITSDPIAFSFVGNCWGFVQGFEGGIILASNHEMRSHIFKRRKKPSTSIFVSSVSV